MLETTLAVPRSFAVGSTAVVRGVDLVATPESAFARICEVEKWPVWLSIVRRARCADRRPLELGSEIAISSILPDGDDELFEVDAFVPRHRLTLVGAYSARRRIDLRVERKHDRCRVVASIDWPVFGGSAAAIVDRATTRRRVARELDRSLVYLKGLAEFEITADGPLADF